MKQLVSFNRILKVSHANSDSRATNVKSMALNRCVCDVAARLRACDDLLLNEHSARFSVFACPLAVVAPVFRGFFQDHRCKRSKWYSSLNHACGLSKTAQALCVADESSRNLNADTETIMTALRAGNRAVIGAIVWADMLHSHTLSTMKMACNQQKTAKIVH